MLQLLTVPMQAAVGRRAEAVPVQTRLIVFLEQRGTLNNLVVTNKKPEVDPIRA